MKICTKCKLQKEDECFAFRNKAKFILHSRCIECKREIDRIAYHNNTHGRKDRIREVSTDSVAKAKEYIRNVRQSSSCAKCGDDRWYVLDFHHLGGKDRNISTMSYCSIETIKKEIKKCEIVCSNCHREIHFLEKNTGGNGGIFLRN